MGLNRMMGVRSHPNFCVGASNLENQGQSPSVRLPRRDIERNLPSSVFISAS